jgi:hypothetical protein
MKHIAAYIDFKRPAFDKFVIILTHWVYYDIML